MKTGNRARFVSLALMTFCLMSAVAATALQYWFSLFMVLVPLALGAWIWAELRRTSGGSPGRTIETERDESAKSKLYLQTLNHQRHDFMNDIQVLYGYIRLKKYDKLLDYVENIKSKAVRESSISRLGAAELALYLYSFRVRHQSVALDVELDQDINLADLPVDSEETGEMTMRLIEAIVRQVRPGSIEPDRLAMELYTEEDALYICFEFYGESNVKGLEEAVDEAVGPYRETLSAQADSRIEEQWATVEVRVPFREHAVSA